MEIRVANSASFGLDEDLAGLGARHAELLHGERAAGLPEHRRAHEARPARHVVPRGVRYRREGPPESAADPAEGAAGSGGDGHGVPANGTPELQVTMDVLLHLLLYSFAVLLGYLERPFNTEYYYNSNPF